MSSGSGDVKQLLEQIVKLCGKIPVAKKEALQLATLCEALGNRLGDHSHQSNYDDIKSKLVNAKEQLKNWSRFSLPKSLMKRAQIEKGITEFIGELEVISQAIQPGPSSSPDHGAHPPDGRGVEETPTRRPREGSVTGTSINMFQSQESLPRHTTGSETQDTQSVEANEPPPVKRLDGQVTRIGDIAFAGGMYCDVWEGEWKKSGGGKGNGGENVEVEKVALKALKTLKSPERAREKLEAELPNWAELHHQNILPFYGIITNVGQRLHMVSPWQENGNLLVYVKKTPQANKSYLLRGSAAGLAYLHARGIVHGSVKCKNVLVSSEGEPQICDFGIAKISDEVNENATSRTISSGDIVRYSAPELIENNNAPATTYSDAYSFAMLILECITEEVPFSNLPRDAAVIHARLSKKQSPPRPDGQDQKNRVSDGLWELMTRCWVLRPDQRPTMDQVHTFFLDHP